ncbi:peptidase S8 [Fusobacterium necrophorum subsp. funduliforme]|uniref:Peptidase, S8/S53 family n=4 Tax=Fusobacterium necrophorum TaxID=859 RepID=A0AAN3VV49_9FUSO|nr:S8 family serine peptidase [Fusobacterium necrophorum]AYV95540.1 peptidase S8 [Fusobacterium necrophorum subsp. funduliforme]EJU16526.1 peptidase, S8/S53 family [Fusobacterium necrophorum subsp. funduliforme Fnf 1007]KYL00713.1 peptidase S8 [Fusobacterium necrophorum subsp. funduliforme]KYL02039.1 peptidase S8 [Fusobacterium necrophorum subsp. funduliforme]KYM39768.1 peptidase S8 [Fusobacterium necrophorum subsp. funduliforme]
MAEYKKHYKVKLKKRNGEEKEIQRKTWEHFLEEKGVCYQRKEFFPGYSIYKIGDVSEELQKEIERNPEVDFIQPMHRYFLNFQSKQIDREREKLLVSEEKVCYPVIGILDNGIARLTEFENFLYEDGSSYCKEEKYPSHGTFVAGVLLYGDLLSGQSWAGGKELRIFDAAVVPDFSVYQLEEDELYERIYKAVSEHSWIKIWNLAISIRFPIDKNRISDFGLLLDYLQENYDILICKSCGNGNFIRSSEEVGMMLQGSDTERALVVASCNQEKKVSGFSLRGNGHKILQKPDIAMYGGDIFRNEEGKNKIEGVFSFSPEGEIVSSFGTSFATARMSRIVGNILYWKAEASSLFLKAMVVQAATGYEKYSLGYGCSASSEGIYKEYQNSVVKEATLLHAEERFSFRFSGHKILATFVSDVVLDYQQENGYILGDISWRMFYKGQDISFHNTLGHFEAFSSLKKIEMDMEEERGEVEVVIFKRKKQSYFEEERKKLRYCLIWKK